MREREVALLVGQRLDQVNGFGDGLPHPGGRKAFTDPVGRHVTVQLSGRVGRHPWPDVVLAAAPQVHPADTSCPESAGSRIQQRGPDPTALPVRGDV